MCLLDTTQESEVNLELRYHKRESVTCIPKLKNRFFQAQKKTWGVSYAYLCMEGLVEGYNLLTRNIGSTLYSMFGNILEIITTFGKYLQGQVK